MRTIIINELIKANNYQTYLELGVDTGNNFSNINCKYVRGVDLSLISGHFSHLNHRLFIGTTNQYFDTIPESFDIIFIDADHESGQWLLDVENSLDRLNDGGVIVCHDVLPEKEEHQMIPRVSEQWTGDVWKGWMHLRNTRPDLTMAVINQDWGCGLIKVGKQKCTNVLDEDLTWSNFRVRKKKWLPIVKEIPDEFK